MANNRLTRKQRAAVVRRQKITLAAGIAVLILVIIFVLAFKGCNSKKKNNDKTVPANTETTTDDNKTATENNSENIKSEETQDASTSSDNSSDYSGSQYADSQSVSSKGFSIQTINGITYVDGVLIANKTYSLPSDFIPQDPEVPEAQKHGWSWRALFNSPDNEAFYGLGQHQSEELNLASDGNS